MMTMSMSIACAEMVAMANRHPAYTWYSAWSVARCRPVGLVISEQHATITDVQNAVVSKAPNPRSFGLASSMADVWSLIRLVGWGYGAVCDRRL